MWGSAPRPASLLKKAGRKLFSHGYVQTLCHFGTDNREAVIRQRKAYAPTKKARFLFGDVAFARPRPSYDGLKMTWISSLTFVFANSFVLHYGNTHFARKKSF
jgi:hypothetical protein